jgi:hypothetical protein
MNNTSGLRVNLYREIGIANPHSAIQQRGIAKRQQGCAATYQSFGPRRSAWTEANLRVKELDIRLVETVLLQADDLAGVVAKHGRQARRALNCLDE